MPLYRNCENFLCKKHFRFSSKFCGIFYVRVFLKIINIPNIKLVLKVWKIETTESKKIHSNFMGGSSILRPSSPSGFITGKTRVSQLLFHIQSAILIALELVSHLLSSLISLLSMITNSLTCNFHLG